MTDDPIREFATDIVRRLRAAGFEALWAGGCVRDALLGRDPGDYDVATSARPNDVRRIFPRTLAVGASFGVMIVLGKKHQGHVEVATFRADGEYLDGRRPKDVVFCSAERDAQRRDFTINGMFYDPIEDKVIDYVGGQADLNARVLRAIGTAGDRFAEDKLRLLRAVRFAATLDFDLEQATAAAVRLMAPQISVVSAERITQELKKMLTSPERTRAMQLVTDTGLLRPILPEIDHFDAKSPAAQTLARLEAPSFESALAAVLTAVDTPAAVREICRRLKLSNKETEATAWLLEHIDALKNATSLPSSDLKRLLVHPRSPELIALVRARDADSDETDAKFCAAFLRDTPSDVLNPLPLLTGDQLIEAGLTPGPQFKQLLETIRDAQLNGEITTPAQALAAAKRLADS